MKTQIVAAAVVFACASAGAAAAQDRFSGPYLGLTYGETKGDFEFQDAPLFTAPGSTFFGTFGGTIANSRPVFDVDGEEFGLTAGVNWRRGPIVWGVELDGQAVEAEGRRRITDRPAPGTNQFNTNLAGDIDRSASARGRLGFVLADSVLLYGTAGGAWANATLERNYDNAGGQTIRDDTDRSLTGVVYGGGAELALGQRWSVKAEYLKTDFEEENFATLYSDGTSANARIDADRETARVGVNFHF